MDSTPQHPTTTAIAALDAMDQALYAARGLPDDERVDLLTFVGVLAAAASSSPYDATARWWAALLTALQLTGAAAGALDGAGG